MLRRSNTYTRAVSCIYSSVMPEGDLNIFVGEGLCAA
jgi:hypothetical protein